MASRENQGLQIALILFVMITVALGVTTYVFYQKSVTSEADMLKALADKAIEAKKSDALSGQNKLLQHWIGHADLPQPEVDSIYQGLKKDQKVHDETKEIEVKYKATMALFTESDQVTLADGPYTGAQNLLTLPTYLVAVIHQKNQQWEASEARAANADKEKATAVAAEVNKTQQAEKALAVAQADLADERTKFVADRDVMKKSNDVLQTQIVEVQKEKQKIEIAATSKIKDLEQKVTTARNLAVSKDEAIRNLQRKDYDVPDGKVRWVNQQSRIVYINLGSADFLKRQTTFSVYDSAETNHTTAKPKASVEVTQIMERHLSVARILEDDIKNPILPGDFVFTPAWVPGMRLHFAMTGLIDFNGDGKSDRHLLKNLITGTGGIIDEEMDEEGERVGKGITVHTRYLILGERPDEKTVGKGITNYGKMTRDAEQYGVEKISVEKFLGFTGYKGEVTTRTLSGGDGDTGKYKFKPRKPESGKGGAYK